MKRNKFILKVLTIMFSLGLIFSSSLAFLTDRADTSASGTAGTFDIEVFSELSGKDFMIPNKAYGLSTSISNLGNKSADIKVIITLKSDDSAVLAGSPAIIDIYNVSDLLDGNIPNIGAVPLTKTENPDGTVTYILESVVNGNSEFTETEIESGVNTDTYVPDLALCIGDYSSTSATYVTITVDIYSKQHRNTGDWELITTYNEVKNY